MSIYRAQTMTLYLLVLSSLGTVFTAEAFEWPLALGIFVATCTSLVIPYRLRARWAKSRLVVVALLLMLASIGSEVWVGNRDIISGATLFLVLVLVSRLYTPRASSDAIQVLTLSFVVVLAGSALNTSFAFAPYFILVIICSIWALTTTHLTKTAELRPDLAKHMQISRRFWLTTSALAIVIFLQTTVFFVVFPRMGLGYFKPKVRTATNATGFSDRVELGHSGVLEGDTTVVARIEFPEGTGSVDPESFYFRGATLDLFDGVRWSKTPVGQQMVRYRADGTFETREVDRPAKVHFVFYQEPTEAEYLFLPETTPVARLLQDNPLWTGRPRVRFYTDVTGDLMMVRPLGMAVQLEGWMLQDAPIQGAPNAATLALPALDARIGELAAKLRGEASEPDEIVARLSTAFRNFTYTTQMEAPPEGENPIAFFLFERKSGHCEYFASTLAVMLRQSGIPARMVTGYRGASLNPFGGYYALQESRAHTWVEYYVKDRGWQRTDPTPPSLARDPTNVLERMAAFSDLLRYRWNRYVVEYDLDVQVEAWRGIKKSFEGNNDTATKNWTSVLGQYKERALTVALAVLCTLAGVWLWRRRQTKSAPKDREATKLWNRLERALAKRGVRRRPLHITPLAYMKVAISDDEQIEAPLRAFADAYLHARFSANPVQKDLEAMAAALAQIHALPRAREGAVVRKVS
jgi:protein-glutamine gamma-glutamyltransferase